MSKNFTRFLSLTLLVGLCCISSWSYAQCAWELSASDVVMVTDLSTVCDGDELTYEVQGYATDLYEFAFNAGSFSSVNQFGVTEGESFTVQVKELASNCLSTEVTIASEDVLPLSFVVTKKDITCYGAKDGMIHLDISGGTFDGDHPYQMVISNQGWRNIEGASKDVVVYTPGVYEVRVRDGNGCETAPQQVIINEPAPVTVSLTPNFAGDACYMDEAGSIDVKVSGGNDVDYTIQLKDSEGTVLETATAIAGLYSFTAGYAAGTYSVVAYDSKSCEGTGETTIEGKSPITFAAEVTEDLLCKGAAAGVIDVSGIEGGTDGAGYVAELYDSGNTLVASQTAIGGSAELSGLMAGDYSVFVRDGNGCLSEGIELSVWEPAEALLLEAEVVSHIRCTEPGEFTIRATGGVPGYMYYYATVDPATGAVPTATLPGENTVWMPAAADGTLTVSVETPATYVVWVKDADGQGCLVGGELAPEWRVQVDHANPPVTFNTDITKLIACNGESTGEITISNIDGGESANYEITVNGDVLDGMVISDLVAGTYEITVTETVGGCEATEQVVISQPDELVITEFIRVEGVFSCPDATEGWLEAKAEGGSGSYSYQLYQDGTPYGSEVSIPSFVVPIGAEYAVKVMDDNCEAMSESIVLDQVPDVQFTVEDQTCFGATSVTVLVSASGAPSHQFEVSYAPVVDGVEGMRSAWETFDSTIEIEGLSYEEANAGNYNFYVRYFPYECGETTQLVSLAAVESGLTATVEQDDLNATVTPSGGEAPYSYLLNGVSTAGPDFVLPEGTNTITVVDARGCTYDVVVTVDPISLTANPSSGDAMPQEFDVVLTFNREVTLNEGDVVGGTVTPGTGTEFTVSMSGNDGEVLTLTVGTGIKDAANNSFAGDVFTYTLGNTPPVLESFSPTGQQDDNHPEFVMTFSEAVQLSGVAGDLIITKAGESEAWMVIPLSSAVINGNTVTISYDYDADKGGLDRQTTYFVNVDAGAIEDLAGNDFAGLTDQTSWTFTTGDWLTSIEDPSEVAEMFSVYPNPFDTYITIKNASKLSRIMISNIAGQRVKDLVNPTEIINTGDLRSGIYFLTLVDKDDAVVKTERIIKQ
ncbi:Ig-like domain-containing protein [Sunxiuqinia rutila]|uniref:Ig-like domain-containing protein n=1 Tax=Sunxiuqinia rutila TaxID=1397841 RepID=UPI003D360488